MSINRSNIGNFAPLREIDVNIIDERASENGAKYFSMVSSTPAAFDCCAKVKRHNTEKNKMRFIIPILALSLPNSATIQGYKKHATYTSRLAFGLTKCYIIRPIIHFVI